MAPSRRMVGPIDLAFTAAMPRFILHEIVRGNEGVAALWLAPTSDRIAVSLALVRDATTERDIVGWLVGIAMFDDARGVLAEATVRERHLTIIPAAVDAFVAGVLAQVATQPRQWRYVDRMVSLLATPPRSLVGILALGCASDEARARISAEKWARALGGEAREALELARDASSSPTATRRLWSVTESLPSRPVDAHESPADLDLFGRLLAAWCETRDPAIEAMTVKLGSELGRGRGPLVARSKRDLEKAWHVLAEAADPIDLDRLLDTPWPSATRHAIERVRLLATFTPDPRVSRKLARVARMYPAIGASALHVMISEVIERAPTHAIIPDLAAIDESHAAHAMYERLRTRMDELETGVPDPALLAEAVRRTATGIDLDALWAQHRASPEDMVHRTVLADGLQVTGDPRGELITIQLAIASTPSAQEVDPRLVRRAGELLDAYRDVLIGPLPGVDRDSAIFERGFLVAVRTNASEVALVRSLDRLEWLTVEELWFGGFRTDPSPLVARMPLLHRFVANSADALASLARAGSFPNLRAVGCTRSWRANRTTFPNIAVIGGRWVARRDPDAFRTAQEHAAALGVSAIVHFQFGRDDLPAAIPHRVHGPAETRFALGSGRFGSQGDSFNSAGWNIRVRRADATADLAWHGARMSTHLTDKLDLLRTSGMTCIRVHLGSLHDDLATELARATARLAEHGVLVEADGPPIDLGAP